MEILLLGTCHENVMKENAFPSTDKPVISAALAVSSGDFCDLTAVCPGNTAPGAFSQHIPQEENPEHKVSKYQLW